jgi:hypothetical protein
VTERSQVQVLETTSCVKSRVRLRAIRQMVGPLPGPCVCGRYSAPSFPFIVFYKEPIALLFSPLLSFGNGILTVLFKFHFWFIGFLVPISRRRWLTCQSVCLVYGKHVLLVQCIAFNFSISSLKIMKR